MTTISPVRTPQMQMERKLKPVLYTVFVTKFLVAALLIAAVNMPTPSAHAGPSVGAQDF